MTGWRALRSWLRGLFGRGRTDADLDDEIRAHLDLLETEHLARGLSPSEAREAARREFGAIEPMKERVRDTNGLRWIDDAIRDTRYAVRVLRRSPAFTSAAVLTLALGIGASTAMYSFMDAILLRALPVPDPQSLVVFKWQSRRLDFSPRALLGGSTFVMHAMDGQVYDEGSQSVSRIFPFPAFERLQQIAGPVVASVFAYRPTGRLNIVTNAQADVVYGEYVSGGYFQGLAVAPAAGRPIVAADDRPGAASVAVLSMEYARRRFGDPAAAVNRSIRVNDVSFTIVGVAPAEFFGVDPAAAPDVFLPLHAGEVSPDPNYYWLEMMARLRPGTDVDTAQAVLRPAFQQWVATTVTNNRERLNLPELRLDSGATGLETLRRRYSRPLYVLLAIVGLLLAIACANIANLLLARAAARQREIAVRLSVGAGRARIVRQLLTESLCLACIAGGVALPVAFVCIRGLTMLLANGDPAFALRAELNWHVLLVTCALSLCCGLVFGLAPAFRATAHSLVPALKGSVGSDARVGRVGVYRLGVMQALVISQIAISLLLLVAAGLFVRTLSNLESIPMGFNPDRLLLFDVNASQAGPLQGDVASFYADLRRRLSVMTGVTSATLSHASLMRAGRRLALSVDGVPAVGARVLSVGPAFFTTMGIRVLEGREIDERDRSGAQGVAVVDEQFARTFLGRTSALGRHIALGGRVPLDLEVIGVAASAQYGELRDRRPPVVYLSYGQITSPPIGQMTFALRTATDPQLYSNAVRAVVQQANSLVPVANMRTQTTDIQRTINQEIIFARLGSAFALLALVIATVGLYGTMAYAVTRRTPEIGIRMALGASAATVVWMILWDVFVLVGLSLAISLPIALGASHAVESLLFAVKPNDPYALTAAVGVLATAALLAGYVPARRAARIDPNVALRAE